MDVNVAPALCAECDNTAACSALNTPQLNGASANTPTNAGTAANAASAAKKNWNNKPSSEKPPNSLSQVINTGIPAILLILKLFNKIANASFLLKNTPGISVVVLG